VSEQSINFKGPIPIRSQFRSLVLDSIAGGAFPPGERIPSERDLATQFGISRTSVRETLTELVSEGVLFRSGRGTFVAEATERRANGAAARQIAFLISDEIFHFVQPGYSQILSGVTEECLAAGCQVVFHPLSEGASLDEASPNAGVDGFMVTGGVRRATLERLKTLGKPLVLVDLLVSDEQLPTVAIDYASGVNAAVDHLVELGHRNLGFIGFPASAKYDAFWQALERHGLAYHPNQVRFLNVAELEPGIAAGYHAMRKLLDRSAPPSALLVTNDLVALGVIEALRVAGLEVPRSISIVGCDDLGQSSNPPLTTIRVDLAGVGRLAARALLARVRGESIAEPLLVPVELVVRNSTATPEARSL
jgi:DNA-binding LacI/PurR family transcriptional regulator